MSSDQHMDRLDGVIDTVARQRPFPESTYRLQFHAGFTFRDAQAIAGYLHDLGVSHAYASPFLQARAGSTHGYDIVDHNKLNPELGSEEDFEGWVADLHRHGLGQILDIVPNHMGVATNDNAWWNDVLENGPASQYAAFFDIAWGNSPRPELHDKVLLPVLGEPYGKVLESGQLRLAFEGGGFALWYYDRRFPVAPRSYEVILSQRLEELEGVLGADSEALAEYQSILTAIRHLPDRTDNDPDKMVERRREKEVIKRRLGTLVRDNPAVQKFLDQTLERFNGKPGEPHSFDLLDKLLTRQCYRLAYWRVAADEINYRRFFDINDLAAVSMEREDVFRSAHQLILRLLVDGKIQGVRIDHPDGLYDPKRYFDQLQEHYLLAHAAKELGIDTSPESPEGERLQAAVRERLRQRARLQGPASRKWPLYVVAEKILGTNEPLPETWAVDGTSGYDFLSKVNGLYVDNASGSAFTRLYQEYIQEGMNYDEVVYQKKNLILRVALASELFMLAHQLDRLAQKHRSSRDFTLASLRAALRETIACFSIYRSYIAEEVTDTDRRAVLTAVRRARGRNPVLSGAIFDFVRDMLLLRYPEGSTEEDRAEQLRFAGKFQQVTSPVTAKGVEDTAFYVYNRLVSLNEVGGDPGQFGTTPEVVHRYLADRQKKWPYALSPLSTHDTKRSEDVRARINVLSEIPDQWREAVRRWSQLNDHHRVHLEEQEVTAPDANESYLLYQGLLGVWPPEPIPPEEKEQLIQRLQAFLVKALHEAKVHSSWINPNTAYDEAVTQFLGRILDEGVSGEFLNDFRTFQKRISHHGLLNALSQTLVRLAAPGVPDTYQGTELWDFSLVDPDNRRPVDYERRRQVLSDLKARVDSAGDKLPDLARELAEHKDDGRIKMYVTSRALHARRDHPGLFSAGDYLPLESAGARAAHVFAFARRQGDRFALVAVPRLTTRLVEAPGLPLGPEVWEDTRLTLPTEGAPTRLRNLFTGEVLTPSQGVLNAADLFRNFPVALLLAEPT